MHVSTYIRDLLNVYYLKIKLTVAEVQLFVSYVMFVTNIYTVN